MLEEFKPKKYNPSNTLPEYFLRPPTSFLQDEFIEAAGNATADLNEHGCKIPLIVSKRRVSLLIGTELEVYFFPRNVDPTEPQSSFQESSCYKDKHLRKVEAVSYDSRLHSLIPGISDVEKISRLGIEFRTPPGDLGRYIDCIENIRNALSRRCNDDGLNPVVHSQHIHISVFSNSKNLIDSSRAKPKNLKNELDRTAITQLLPEEFYEINSRPARYNGSTNILNRNPVRLEIRRLSSEYACDPFMNVLTALAGTKLYLEGNSFREYTELETPENFSHGLDLFRNSEHVLTNYLGTETQRRLADVISVYPMISSRSINLDRVKP